MARNCDRWSTATAVHGKNVGMTVKDHSRLTTEILIEMK